MVRRRAAPQLEVGRRATAWSVTGDGVRLVFHNQMLRTLLLFWLAGRVYIVPEGLAVPYAREPGGAGADRRAADGGHPAGDSPRRDLPGADEVTGAGAGDGLAGHGPVRAARRLRCYPPLWVVLVLWVLAGIGGAFQLAAAPAFVAALDVGSRASAFGVAQSGLYAVQGLGVLGGGGIADFVGVPFAVSVAGLLGLCTATRLAVNWSRLRLPRYFFLALLMNDSTIDCCWASSGRMAQASR